MKAHFVEAMYVSDVIHQNRETMGWWVGEGHTIGINKSLASQKSGSYIAVSPPNAVDEIALTLKRPIERRMSGV